MNKYKYILFSTALFLTNINISYAACTQEEIQNFKKIEDEYTIKYELDKSTKTYNLYFTSTMSEKYYYQIYADIELACTAVDSKTVKCINFPPDKYEILITGVTDTCQDILKTINIKLPKYNSLSEDPLCEGIEEFVLCNPSYEKEIDYDTFVSRVNTYKKTKNKKEEIASDIEDETHNKMLSKIENYIKENWIQIIIIVIFIILVLITIIVTTKSIRKSRYLE